MDVVAARAATVSAHLRLRPVMLIVGTVILVVATRGMRRVLVNRYRVSELTAAAMLTGLVVVALGGLGLMTAGAIGYS